MPKLNWCTVIIAIALSAAVNGQTTKPSTSNPVTFHDIVDARVTSIPEPPPALQQISVELAGTLVGQPPNLSIQFTLILQNNGPQEVKIRDPLDSLSLNFSAGKGPIAVPERIRGDVVGLPKDAIGRPTPTLAYPAPIQFRRIVRGTLASYEREESLTIPAGGKVQIVFESEPVVMERVMEALLTQTGEAARSFKAKGFLALISDPPAAGGRSLYSDPISFTIPAP